MRPPAVRCVLRRVLRSRDRCAGKGMYYDKAFEAMQKMGGARVAAVAEPTKVDCLYDLHYK